MTASNVVVLEQPQTSDTWVLPFIKGRYPVGLTQTAYLGAWERLSAFFAARGIALATLTRAHCYEFFDVRSQTVNRNTAVWDTVVLSLICEEAVARGVLSVNPARRLGLARETPKEKPEISEALQAEIEEAIRNLNSKHRDFLRISFAIGIRHGIRIAETRFPLCNVHLDSTPPTMMLMMKGRRRHVVPIHPQLIPLFGELKAKGAEWTFGEPSKPRWMSQVWDWFFRREGFDTKLPGICFHCCRVTVISRLARANVSEAKCMRFVNHSSQAVHKIYQRVQLSDLNDCLSALK